ncbi:MAG: hypothetical protein ABSF52_22210, partial [Syntrophobacteraceae bacterium]
HKNFLSFKRHRSRGLSGLDYSVLLDSHKLLKVYSPVFKKKKALLAGTPHFKRENRFPAINTMIRMWANKGEGLPIRNPL